MESQIRKKLYCYTKSLLFEILDFTMETEDYTCIICGKKKKVLLSVILADDQHEIFHRRRGVCEECLRNPNKSIGLTCESFAKRQITEQINKAEDSIKHWKEELRKLEEKE